MVVDGAGEEADDLGTKLDHQKRQNAETEKPPEKNGGDKTAEPHLDDARRQDKQLKRSGRRKHGGHHKRKESVVLERSVNLLKTLCTHALYDEDFASLVADPVNDDAAERRT